MGSQVALVVNNPSAIRDSSSIPGIFQATVLEWVAIAFSDCEFLLLLLSRFSRVQLCATP